MMTFKVFSLVMALLIFSMPFSTLAQQTTDAHQAFIDAKNDVKNPTLYALGAFFIAIGSGCLGGSVFVLASQLLSAKTTSLPTYW